MQSLDNELSTSATSPDTCLQLQLFMDIRFSPEAKERDVKHSKADTPCDCLMTLFFQIFPARLDRSKKKGTELNHLH